MKPSLLLRIISRRLQQLLFSTIVCCSPLALYADNTLLTNPFTNSEPFNFDSKILQYVNTGDEHFIEQWQILGQLSNGGLINAYFSVNNIGFGDEHINILIKYISPKLETHVESIIGKRISTVSSPFSVTIDNNYIKKTDDGYEVKIHGNDIKIDAILNQTDSSYHLTEKNNKKFVLSAIVPSSKFEGTLGANGINQQIDGHMYIDHSESYTSYTDYSKSWRSFRHHSEQISLNFLSIRSSENVDYSILYFKKKNSPPKITNDCKITINDIQRANSDWTLNCKNNEQTIKLLIKPKATPYSSSLLKRYNKIYQFIARSLAVNPYGYSFAHEHRITVIDDNHSFTEPGAGFSELLILDTSASF